MKKTLLIFTLLFSNTIYASDRLSQEDLVNLLKTQNLGTANFCEVSYRDNHKLFFKYFSIECDNEVSIAKALTYGTELRTALVKVSGVLTEAKLELKSADKLFSDDYIFYFQRSVK